MTIWPPSVLLSATIFETAMYLSTDHRTNSTFRIYNIPSLTNYKNLTGPSQRMKKTAGSLQVE